MDLTQAQRPDEATPKEAIQGLGPVQPRPAQPPAPAKDLGLSLSWLDWFLPTLESGMNS